MSDHMEARRALRCNYVDHGAISISQIFLKEMKSLRPHVNNDGSAQ
jgi:hypothetical protein